MCHSKMIPFSAYLVQTDIFFCLLPPFRSRSSFPPKKIFLAGNDYYQYP